MKIIAVQLKEDEFRKYQLSVKTLENDKLERESELRLVREKSAFMSGRPCRKGRKGGAIQREITLISGIARQPERDGELAAFTGRKNMVMLEPQPGLIEKACVLAIRKTKAAMRMAGAKAFFVMRSEIHHQ